MPRGSSNSVRQPLEIKAPLHSMVMLVFLIFGISIGVIFVFLMLMVIGLAAS